MARENFTVSSEVLGRLFQAWSLPSPKARFILFGLRGCLPVTTGQGWSASSELAMVPVDHVHMRCTLGICDTSRNKVFAAPGSTVPHEANVIKAAAHGGKGANCLEPGYYTDLTKGEHLQGKLRGHQALRQTAARFYRRAPKGLPYSDASPLFFGNPYDNLHCGWQLDPNSPGFSSSGCMVVAGLPFAPRLPDAESNQGPWKIFHDLLYAEPQKSFPILLLPAVDAAAALAGARVPAKSHPRLVFGSQGEPVKALQRKLAAKGFYLGRADGALGPRTYRAWNRSGFTAF